MPINFTKESVHEAFCNMPYEQKKDFAISCAKYDVAPESVENLFVEMLKCVEPIVNKVIENLNTGERSDN